MVQLIKTQRINRVAQLAPNIADAIKAVAQMANAIKTIVRMRPAANRKAVAANKV